MHALVDNMKILSHNEFEFLKSPEKYNRNYQYVLSHRIKKKVESMENTLAFINFNHRALLTDKKKDVYDLEKQKDKWWFIVKKAFEKMKDDKKKLYKKYADIYIKKDRDNKDIDNINKILWEYQKSIVKLYLGDEYLKYEQH